MVVIRKSQLQRARELMARGDDMVAAVEVDDAQRRLANAQYRLAFEQNDYRKMVKHLQRIISLCEEDLRELFMLKERNAAAERQVELSKWRLVYARYYLARAKARQTAQVTHWVGQGFAIKGVLPVGGAFGSASLLTVHSMARELDECALPHRRISNFGKWWA